MPESFNRWRKRRARELKAEQPKDHVDPTDQTKVKGLEGIPGEPTGRTMSPKRWAKLHGASEY